MYTQVICLANSRKRGDRCIAGIELSTGRWVRPVTNLDDGRIPSYIRLIQGNEPALLDILEIPLSETGPSFGFASENRLILPGMWRLLGKVEPNELIKYTYNLHNQILHNTKKYVLIPFLQSQPVERRQTLQLVHVSEFEVKNTERVRGGSSWKGTIKGIGGEYLVDANITDPVFVEKLNAGYRPKTPCFVTVSLSMPWRPSDWEGEDPCWKLIASVIEANDVKASKDAQKYINLHTNNQNQTEFYTAECLYTLNGQTPINFTPDSKTLTARSHDTEINAVKFWNIDAGKLSKTLQIPAIDFSPSIVNHDNAMLVNIADGDTIQLWNTNEGYLIRCFVDNTFNTILSVALSKDGSYIATANNSIKIWKQDTSKQLVHQLYVKSDDNCIHRYSNIEFSPNCEIIASKVETDYNTFVALWNVKTGELINRVGAGDNINTFAFSPDNKQIITTNQDGTIKFWNLETFQPVFNIIGHKTSVNCICFSSDGKIIATASQSEIKLWSMASCNLLLTIHNYTDSINSIIFSQDAELIASSSKDNQIKLWKLIKSHQKHCDYSCGMGIPARSI